MPLLDHFHPPLSVTRHWEGFHTRWAAAIADAINPQLPSGYYAEPKVHYGATVEADVSTFELLQGGDASGSVAVLAAPQTLEVADLVLPASFPPDIGVHVIHQSGGPKLVAAVELLSPGNKDRPSSRRTFAAKCSAYLSDGIGVVAVDVVTRYRSVPPRDLLQLLDADAAAAGWHDGQLSAVSYTPAKRDDDGVIELRVRRLTLGEALPTLPLSIGRGYRVSIDFEAAYEQTRTLLRM